MKKREKIRDILYPSVYMLLAVVAATLAVSVIAALVTGVSDPGAKELDAVPLLASAAFYLVTLFTQRRYFRIDELRFGSDLRCVRPAVLIAAVLVSMAGSDLLERLIDLAGLYDLFPVYETVAVTAFQNQNPILLAAVTVVLAPLAEELVFRGMTYRRIRQYLGVLPGILLSALLFGVYHMNTIQFLYAGALGLLFAWLYEHTGTLIVPVAGHAAANAWALLAEACIDRPQLLAGRAAGALMPAEALITAAGLWLLAGWFRAPDGQSR